MNTEQPKFLNKIEMQNCNVIMGDSNGGIFALPGAQPIIHQYAADSKGKPSQSTQGPVEAVDTREQRKDRGVTETGSQGRQGAGVTHTVVPLKLIRAQCCHSVGSAPDSTHPDFNSWKVACWHPELPGHESCLLAPLVAARSCQLL